MREITVGARTITLVQDSSPSIPVEPFIPENVAVICIGPGSLSPLASIEAEARPSGSVSPPQTVLLSTVTTIVADEIGDPELSIKEMLRSMVDPRTVLLSGSKSVGLRIESNE